MLFNFSSYSKKYVNSIWVGIIFLDTSKFVLLENDDTVNKIYFSDEDYRKTGFPIMNLNNSYKLNTYNNYT